MANKRIWLGILVMVLVFGMAVVGCDNGSTNGSGSGNGSGNGTGGTDGKVTISLLAGSGTGNIRLKLSEGTWNSNATQSLYLKGIMDSLLTTYSNGIIDSSKCIATIIESNTALNIELWNSKDQLEIAGEVRVKTALNPSFFPYTSLGTFPLNEKFQVSGGPVTFVNKTVLYTSGSNWWTNGTCQIGITESSITFYGPDGAVFDYNYNYNIDAWKSDYVGGQYCVTLNVSNGKKTNGNGSPPSCISDKTSFTFYFDYLSNSIYIRQADGVSFSGTNGWQYSLTK